MNTIDIADKSFVIHIKWEEIKSITFQLAEEISKDFADKNIVAICVLKGAVFFFSDILKNLTISKELETDFIQISSYKGTQNNPEVKLIKEITTDIKDKHVLLVEDIIDTGQSVSYLLKYLNSKNPISLSICTLINKTEKRKINIEPDYKGFDIKSGFVVGYGMDYMELGRNLSDIYILNN